MKERTKAVWVVAIFAVLITAGLILGCGDDDGGVSTAACQDACDKLDNCELWNEIPYGEGPQSFEECYAFCDGGNFDAEDKEVINCINRYDDCGVIGWECFGD